jgi:hypothetical protein
MTGPAYPAARITAERVQPHLERDLAAARNAGERDVAPEADVQAIEAIINAAFWASLRREEGYSPTISLAFLSPEHAKNALMLEQTLPLEPDALTRLAPAVERPGIHLGVWRHQEELVVWGVIRHLPAICFVLEVIAPGLLVLKHSRGKDSGKFVNVAVLEADRIKVLNQNAAALPGCPNIVLSLLGFERTGPSTDSVNVLVQLAVSMRAHRRGGSLLVVPDNTDRWRESMLMPMRYSANPPFSGLTGLASRKAEEDSHWQEELRRTVDVIAGLTAVDGATVITDRYRLLAFGAKIGRREGFSRIDQVIVTEPIDGSEPAIVSPGQLGNTRHLSAAQFAHDQRDCVALVASQDDRFTIFSWSACEDMVHAHRVEALLL